MTCHCGAAVLLCTARVGMVRTERLDEMRKRLSRGKARGVVVTDTLLNARDGQQ